MRLTPPSRADSTQSHGEHVPTQTASAALRVKGSLSKAACGDLDLASARRKALISSLFFMGRAVD